MIFLMAIYIQLLQKCQAELVEDIKKDTFRQAQTDIFVIIEYKLPSKKSLFIVF